MDQREFTAMYMHDGVVYALDFYAKDEEYAERKIESIKATLDAGLYGIGEIVARIGLDDVEGDPQ